MMCFPRCPKLEQGKKVCVIGKTRSMSHDPMSLGTSPAPNVAFCLLGTHQHPNPDTKSASDGPGKASAPLCSHDTDLFFL